MALLCVLLAGGLFGAIVLSANVDEPPATPTPIPSPSPPATPTRPVPARPTPPVVQGGDRLYVASTVYGGDGQPAGGLVTALDAATGRELFVIDAGRAGANRVDIALAPDQATLFVADGASISAYRAADGGLIWGGAPEPAFTRQTVVLDPQTGQPTGGPGLGTATAVAARGPPALAVSPDGGMLYVLRATQSITATRAAPDIYATEPISQISILLRFDAATGASSQGRVTLPVLEGRGSLVSGGSPGGATLYYAAPDGAVWLIDPATYASRPAAASRPATALSLAAGSQAGEPALYALDDTGDISVFDPASGARDGGLGVGNDTYFSNGWMQARPGGRLLIHQLRPDPRNGAPTTELISVDPATARQEARYPTGRLLAGGLGALSSDGDTVYLVDDPSAGGEAEIVAIRLGNGLDPAPITRKGDIRRLLLGRRPGPAGGESTPPAAGAGESVAWLGAGTGDGANILAVDGAGGETLVGRNVQGALHRPGRPPLLVTASASSQITLFDPAASRTITVALAPPSTLRPWNFVLSPDGGRLALKTSELGGADGQTAMERIVIADLATGASSSLLSADQEPLVNASILSSWAADGLYLTTYASNRTVIWSIDPAAARPTASRAFVSEQPIAIADFNAAHGLLAYRAAEPAELRLRNLRDGRELLLSPSRQSRPAEAAISPDGAYVAFTRAEGRVQRLLLYDVAGGAERVLSEPMLPIVPPIWSDDSLYLLQSAMRPQLPRDPHLLVFRAGQAADTIRLDEAIIAAGVGAGGQIICLTHDNEYATLNIRRDGVTERVPRTFPLGVARPRLIYIP